MEDDQKYSQSTDDAVIKSITNAFPKEMSLVYEKFRVKTLHTPIGSMIAIANASNLFMLKFMDGKNIEINIKNFLKSMGVRTIVNDDGSNKPLKSITFELDEYFAGNLTVFETPVGIKNGTDYQKAVLRQISDIPYGETSTYAKLAANMDKPKSYRAAANACGQNPICIVIPCHRVLSSSGMGGYSCGVERKEFLLNLEKTAKQIKHE